MSPCCRRQWRKPFPMHSVTMPCFFGGFQNNRIWRNGLSYLDSQKVQETFKSYSHYSPSHIFSPLRTLAFKTVKETFSSSELLADWVLFQSICRVVWWLCGKQELGNRHTSVTITSRLKKPASLDVYVVRTWSFGTRTVSTARINTCMRNSRI